MSVKEIKVIISEDGGVKIESAEGNPYTLLGEALSKILRDMERTDWGSDFFPPDTDFKLLPDDDDLPF